jgi:hypothetical protein
MNKLKAVAHPMLNLLHHERSVGDLKTNIIKPRVSTTPIAATRAAFETPIHRLARRIPNLEYTHLSRVAQAFKVNLLIVEKADREARRQS